MRLLTTLVVAAIAGAGCAREERPSVANAPSVTQDVPNNPPAAARASAAIAPAGASGVEGTARFVDVGQGVRVVVLVRGLEPEGDHYHGLQILAATDCEDVDETSPHFDPDGAPHGPYDAGHGGRHAGDLGNIRAYDGAGRYDRVDRLLDLEGPRSAVGRAIVIRAEADDAWSRDGTAGAIVGCGVIAPADEANGGPAGRPS